MGLTLRDGVKMKLGKFEIYSLSDGFFRLDGGAMFGIIPRTLWEKGNPPDEKNRILLSLRPLLIKTGKENILIDTGIGDKEDAKFRSIYAVDKRSTLRDSLSSLGLNPEDIDIVINTHLHFDHAGGNTLRSPEGKFSPTFPRARYIVQKGELEDALHPNERTAASYLAWNFEPLIETRQLETIEGEVKLLPGVKAMVTGGHTKFHQSVKIESEGEVAIFLGDFIPTLSHLKSPFIMGYDLYPLETLKNKQNFLLQACRQGWLLVFEHDPLVPWGYLTEKKGKFLLRPVKD